MARLTAADLRHVADEIEMLSVEPLVVSWRMLDDPGPTVLIRLADWDRLQFGAEEETARGGTIHRSRALNGLLWTTNFPEKEEEE